jgi:single-strand DNA-binding protein
MNAVTLIGRWTKELELRYTNTQMAVATGTLAVDRQTKQGEEKKADFIRIVIYGKQAETAEKFTGKGSKVAIEGRIQTGSYQNKKGDTVYTTDVVANRVEFLDSRKTAESGNQSVTRQQESAPDGYAEIAEDVPF